MRHMDVVFHQPGKTIRMTGGLGPLQGMGVSGALTYSFINDGSGSKLNVVYNVAGAEFLKLDRIADPVKEVLSMQMDRFQKYCSPPQD